MTQDTLQNKLKIQIKLCINRLRLVQQKMAAIHKQQQKELVILLEKNKVQNAMIKAENIIREDMKRELLGILEVYCDILLSRFYFIKRGQCHEQIRQAVSTLIYSMSRCEIKEFSSMNEIFRLYFGKEFIQDSIENKHNLVDPKVVEKLCCEPLSNDFVENYLQEIMDLYNIGQNNKLNTFNILDSAVFCNEGFKELKESQDSNSASIIHSLPVSDDSESHSKSSIYVNNCNKDTSNNVSNMDQLWARFERLKQN
ncbi:hypothetical protein T552_01581 [Pneumocystis carinii B80]|uniref:Uncharacterized protein n=1 Tax=Pneumocystis carinii (strain B80) TaxID=1408658 RepID=A0A0W4ZKP7_PNEC8|nr:hypothetical protein T552_01581 [Pneumocystis carinii B80]KTW28951.1 hypothetical protein T552_01581 [Pneumocystis carinii B80]